MAVSFDKKYNTSEVSSILYYNGKYFYNPSQPEKYTHFSKVNQNWYVIADTNTGLEFYLLYTVNKLIGTDSYKRPNYSEVVTQLIPIVNGEPDYSNKLVKPF